MSIQIRLNKLRSDLPTVVTLIAVSKRHTVKSILEAYESGQRDFGENLVQEMHSKQVELPKDIRWHLIGHLQSNKVKYIADYVHLIHGVDSLKLLKEINKRAKNEERVISCLLQVHIAREDTKFGFDREELFELISSSEFSNLQYISVKGLMGMATNTENESQISSEFQALREMFQTINLNYSLPNLEMKHLSMGMSNDYSIAIKEGSNMIRVGSLIFGARSNAT
jgi:hypothetical protein